MVFSLFELEITWSEAILDFNSGLKTTYNLNKSKVATFSFHLSGFQF